MAGVPGPAPKHLRYPGYGTQCMPSSLYMSDNFDDQPPTSGFTAPLNGCAHHLPDRKSRGLGKG